MWNHDVMSESIYSGFLRRQHFIYGCFQLPPVFRQANRPKHPILHPTQKSFKLFYPSNSYSNNRPPYCLPHLDGPLNLLLSALFTPRHKVVEPSQKSFSIALSLILVSVGILTAASLFVSIRASTFSLLVPCQRPHPSSSRRIY